LDFFLIIELEIPQFSLTIPKARLMKVFVTGATGYAGFYAAIALREAGHHVYGLTRDGSKPRARELQKHEVELAIGDVSKPDSYRQFIEDK